MNPVHDLVTSVANTITLPDVYQHIRNLVVTPNAQIDDFVQVINRDPALATRIIKMANSRFFGYSREVGTLKQAISLIGVMQLHDLLLSSLAVRAFSSIPADIIDQEVFWRSCIYCGITARLLAKKCNLPASERLFTSSLLHEIGHLLMYAKHPEQTQEILYLFEQSNKPLYMLEREAFGYDYAQAGSELMRQWQLPETYCDITFYHTEPEKVESDKIEIKIVSFARSIMLAVELNPDQPIYSSLNKPSYFFNDKLSRKDIEEITNNAKLYIDDVMDCLWPFAKIISKENTSI